MSNSSVSMVATMSIYHNFLLLFHYYLQGGDTAMPGRLHARLFHAFLVYFNLILTRDRWHTPCCHCISRQKNANLSDTDCQNNGCQNNDCWNSDMHPIIDI